MNKTTNAGLGAQASKQLVTDFLNSWEGRDIDHICSFFTPDAVYHNVPVAPIKGIAGIREIFAGFLSAFEVATLEIITIVAEPNLVLAERMDHFVLFNGRSVDLPVNGVFELKDGKIHRFSDYFDLKSFEEPTGLKL
jgi:limonene-1,2-epoxide hydrolase